MPIYGASGEPQQRSRTKSRSHTAGRVAMGALAFSTILLVPQLNSPAAADSGCGTRWASRVVPPKHIKVYRSASGKVQTVSFRRYVAVVMASGEWPTRLKRATLEAGAVATKQYAWYYALKGKHRSGFRNSKGVCYDVRDDVRDQLYRPERAKPTQKQQTAIDKTWPLTLLKNGRFFLTGYRAGTAARCASDANGWKLFAKSVEDCAAKGWSRGRIQRTYLNPGLSIIRTEHVLGPLLSKPRIKLRTGRQLAARPARITWRKIMSHAPVKRYVLQRRRDGGDWTNVRLADPKATSAFVPLKTGRTHQFRVHAIDRQGERGPWSRGRTVKAELAGPRDATLSGPGGETTESLGGRARIRRTFRSIAYVAPRGPNMGKAVIKVNGRRVKTVDLRNSTRVDGKLIWVKNWKGAKKRTVVVKPVRSDVRVDIEGFLLLR